MDNNDKDRVVCCMTGEEGTRKKFQYYDGLWFRDSEVLFQYKKRESEIVEAAEYITHFILGGPRGRKPPPFLVHKLKDYMPFSHDILMSCIRGQEGSIKRGFEKNGINEERRQIQYILAVIANHITDEHNNSERYERQRRRENKNKNQLLDDIDRIVIDGTPVKGNDMTSFFEDFEDLL